MYVGSYPPLSSYTQLPALGAVEAVVAYKWAILTMLAECGVGNIQPHFVFKPLLVHWHWAVGP